MAFDHLTLATKLFDRTVDFVGNVLEFRKLEHPGNIHVRAAWFEVAPQQAIHVLEIDDVEQPGSDREFGRHVALRFPEDCFNRVRARIQDAGLEIIPPERPASHERFFVRDPNGHCFEFVCRENV